jgi:hypothetical protein
VSASTLGLDGTQRRVVFFLRGRTVPSARARGFTIARLLSDAGYDCLVRAAVPSVDGDSWLPWWCKPVGPVFIPVAAAARAVDLRVLRPGDVVFFQRPLTELPFAILERLVAARHPTILDFDDAIFLTWQNRKKFRTLVEMVDHVIAGNRGLAEAAAVPEKTTVIPTGIDTERFVPFPPSRRRGADVIVGWTGLSRNYPQLSIAAAPIHDALAASGATLRIISEAPPPRIFGGVRVEYRKWSPDTEIEDLADIDIGLMPLPDSPYARGKCAFKLLQYMALGRPAVASPVGVNTEVVRPGHDGFLAASPGDWKAALLALIDDPELRARVGAAARQRIVADYALAALLPRYQSVLAAVAGLKAKEQP